MQMPLFGPRLSRAEKLYRVEPEVLNHWLLQPMCFRTFGVIEPFLKIEDYDNCGLQFTQPLNTTVVLFPPETQSRNQNL